MLLAKFVTLLSESIFFQFSEYEEILFQCKDYIGIRNN